MLETTDQTGAAADDKAALYRLLAQQAIALFEGESDFVANAANLSALIFLGLPDVSWAGCYLLKAGELVLGPFQGKPACVRIAVGKGVCGTAALRRQTIVVPDVHAFGGHIACDAESRSEIVVPLIAEGRLLGVLDVDSARIDRFDDDDKAGLETLAQCLLASGKSVA